MTSPFSLVLDAKCALGEGPGEPLFTASDAAGHDLGPSGLTAGTVMGSFIHLIDRR